MARPSKLTDEQKKTIRELHETLGVSYSDLAKEYGVHFNTILRICSPDTYEKDKAYAKEYQKANIKKISAQRAASQRRYVFCLVKGDDSKLIDHIDAQDNVSQYLRNLVSKDFEDSQTDNSDPEPN